MKKSHKNFRCRPHSKTIGFHVLYTTPAFEAAINTKQNLLSRRQENRKAVPCHPQDGKKSSPIREVETGLYNTLEDLYVRAATSFCFASNHL